MYDECGSTVISALALEIEGLGLVPAQVEKFCGSEHAPVVQCIILWIRRSAGGHLCS